MTFETLTARAPLPREGECCAYCTVPITRDEWSVLIPHPILEGTGALPAHVECAIAAGWRVEYPVPGPVDQWVTTARRARELAGAWGSSPPDPFRGNQ